MLYKKTSSSSLIDLASQLYSPQDRQQYTNVILKKERMMAQIETIQSSLHQHYQQYQLEKQQQQKLIDQQPLPSPVRRKPTFTPTHPNVRHSMSSYSMLLSKSASMYQPKLLEQYDVNHLSLKQIDMLSNQYNNSNTIEQLLVKKTLPLSPLSSSTSSPPSSPSSSSASSIKSTQSNKSSLIDGPSPTPALKVKTTNLSSYHYDQRHQHLPLSPPLSPPTSFMCLSTSSTTSCHASPKNTYLQLSQQASYSPYLQKSTPPSSTTSSQIPNATIDTSKVSFNLPSTPIASPIQQHHTITSHGNNNQTPFYYPAITHIQKNNGMRIRSFLGQSVVLNKTIRLEPQRATSDSRFYQGKDEISGQAKVVLKLVIIKSATIAAQDDDVMAPFGIHFENSAVSGGSTANMSLHAWIPDSLVLEALTVWLVASQLPHLLNACHVMRDGIKLYIVYNASAIY